MRAAIYARRSTDEHQAASLDVQIGEAKRFIEAKGWTIDDANIFIDDAISRAEFKKRPALIRLLNAAEAKPSSFDVVITRDETRLGGDTNRTSLLIQSILDAGCRLHYYFSDEDVRLDGALAKIMVSLRNFASELEREKISQRTHEHLETKARAGAVTGGRVYGFDNVEVMAGERRLHVEHKINKTEARVIVEIFEMYANGKGLKMIAKALNAKGVPSPRAGNRGSGSWAPSTIRPMLRRERYLGRIVWGQREKAYRGGTKVRIARAPAEWTTVEAPHLRIVSEELWASVHARFRQKLKMGRKGPQGAPSKHLLTGFSICGECGGRIKTANGKVSHENTKTYVCGPHRERGDTVCRNGLRRPVVALDAAVMETIASTLLTEERVAAIAKEVRRRLAKQAERGAGEIPGLEKQARKLQAERARLVEAIATTTTAIPSLVAALETKERAIQDIESQIRVLQTAPGVIDLEVRRVEREAQKRVRSLRETVRNNPEEARLALEKLLDGPMIFKPVETRDGKRYRVEGKVSAVALLGASPAGFEPA